VSSVEQNCSGDELDGGEKSAGEFVITGRDGSKMLEFVEEALDQVAFSVKCEIGRAWRYPIRLGWDDRRDPAVFEDLDQAIGIVSLVGEESLRIDLIEQRFGLREVGGLAGRQRDGGRIAECIRNRMDFRRQAASGSTDGLILTGFFWAPALC
jgi:hypothetical protein